MPETLAFSISSMTANILVSTELHNYLPDIQNWVKKGLWRLFLFYIYFSTWLLQSSTAVRWKKRPPRVIIWFSKRPFAKRLFYGARIWSPTPPFYCLDSTAIGIGIHPFNWENIPCFGVLTKCVDFKTVLLLRQIM